MPLTDDQWQLLAGIFPTPVPARGRPPLDDRLILDAILYKFATNTPWYDLPPKYPSHQACYRRYRQWQRTGLLKRLLAILLHDLRTRGGLDLQHALQVGDIALHRQGGRWTITYADHLHGSWQLATAYVFLGMALKSLSRPKR